HIGIEKKQRFISICDTRNGIAPREQFVELHARHGGQRQGFPFESSRPTGKAECAEAIKVLPDATMNTSDQSMLVALNGRKASSKDGIGGRRNVGLFFLEIRCVKRRAAPHIPLSPVSMD